MAAALAGGPPIPYDGYTVSSGAITAPCPTIPGATITCDETLSDNGMFQRKVTVQGLGTKDGTYTQFIMVDQGTSGDAAADPFTSARGSLEFTNEDFVKMYNRGNGISSKQEIIDSNFITPTTEDRFVNTVQYEFGWAQNTANPWVNLHQELTGVDYTNPLLPSVIYQDTADIISNADGFNTNLDVALSEMIDLGDGDRQRFHYKKVSGVYQTTSHALADPDLLPGGTNGGDIAWATGDELRGTWVGQIIGGSSSFGNTRYENYDNSTSTQLANFIDPEAQNWINPPFGTIESVMDTPAVTATAVVAPADPFAGTLTGGTAGGAFSPVTLPVAYNSWTVSGGVYTTDPCTTPGVTCGAAFINESGLLQRAIYMGGDVYYQTIVTDDTATGDPTVADFAAGSLGFRNETFVKVGSNGVASSQHFAEQDLAYVTQWNIANPPPLPNTGGRIVYDVTLKTGWANGGAADPLLSVDQQVIVPDTQHAVQGTTSMYERFQMDVGATDADWNILMQSAAGTNAIAVPGGNYNLYPYAGFESPIMFESNTISGAFQNSTHTLADPALLPSNGGNIAWAPGDAIQATWVGGYYSTSDPTGVATIGTTSYTNLTTGSGARTEYTSVENPYSITTTPDPNPDSWVSPFKQPPPVYQSLFDPNGVF